MVDYTRSTGTSGTLIIRDNGSTVTFLLKNTQGATHASGKSWSGFINGRNVGGTYSISGAQTITLGSWPVSTRQTVTLAIGATNTSGLGGPTSFSQAISRAVPNAPSGLEITRVSDTQQTLNWTRNDTYASVVIQRNTGSGSQWSGWQQVGVASGNAWTYTDRTTIANRRYQYRVAGRDANGQSGWSGISEIYTTPTAPTGVTAARVGDDIRISAVGTAPYATSYDVRDGSTQVGSAVQLPWTHVSPSTTVPHTYQVRARVGSLVSAWSAPSNTVQLLTPPNAPGGIAPNGAVLPSDEDVTFRWTHNPVDASAQSGYELRYRVPGGAWTTLTGTTDSERTVPLEASSWEWQVRTKGAHPNFGAWSPTATFTVVDRPGVAVVQPEATWEASVLEVGWTYLQAQGRPQSSWKVQLQDAAGTTVESLSGTGAATTATLVHRLTEGDWTVSVQAATGGVWSDWASQTFTVVFVPPAPPSIEAEWNEAEGGVMLSVTPGDDPAFEPTAMILVERSIDGGETWETVAEVIEAAQMTDWESLSYGDTIYRATAVTTEGAASTTTLVIEARSDSIWLSAGAGYGVTARLPFDPVVTIAGGRQRALKQYAGRSRPVVLTGEAVSCVITVTGRTSTKFAETAQPDALIQLAQIESDLFLYRDAEGRRVYGAVDGIEVRRQSSAASNGLWGYSFALEEATR